MALDRKLRQNLAVLVNKKNAGMGYAVRWMTGFVLLVQDAERFGESAALIGEHWEADVS